MVRVFVKCHLLPQSLCLDMFTKPTLLKKNCAYHILILTITLNNVTSNSQLKKIGCILIANTNTLRLKSNHDKFHFCLWFKIGNDDCGKTYHKVFVIRPKEVLILKRVLASVRDNLTCKTRCPVPSFFAPPQNDDVEFNNGTCDFTD